MKIATKALAVLATMASTASYAGLIGDEVQARWVYPPYFDQTSVFVVGQGIELNGNWGLGHNLDVGDDYIEATFPDVMGIGPGVNWHFSSLDFGGISGVTVSTNFAGWSDSWLNFTADSIDVTFAQDVVFAFGDGRIRFTLSSAAAPVPEPASGILLGLGLAVLPFVSRRRQSSSRPG